jgi:hypothetical protein
VRQCADIDHHQLDPTSLVCRFRDTCGAGALTEDVAQSDGRRVRKAEGVQQKSKASYKSQFQITSSRLDFTLLRLRYLKNRSTLDRRAIPEIGE